MTPFVRIYAKMVYRWFSVASAAAHPDIVVMIACLLWLPNYLKAHN